MIPWLYHGHVAAYSFNNTRRFMAEDRWRTGRQRPMNAMEITMAHAAGDSSYQHLARARFVDLDFLHSERLIDFTKNSGFDSHGYLLSQKLSLYTPCKTPRARFSSGFKLDPSLIAATLLQPARMAESALEPGQR
jgi:hypothetical protein